MQMQRMQMRMGLPLRHVNCYAQHFAKTYSELLSSMWDGAFCENYARFYFPLSYTYERGEGSRGRSVV